MRRVGRVEVKLRREICVEETRLRVACDVVSMGGLLEVRTATGALMCTSHREMCSKFLL